MTVEYELYAQLHTGFFGQDDINKMEGLDFGDSIVFHDMEVSEDSARIMLFTLECDEEDRISACRLAAEVFFDMGFELWEVNFQDEL